MKLAASIAVFLVAASVWPAQAQNCQMIAGVCARGTRVNMNFQLSGPPPATGATSELTKTMAALSQSLYDVIDHECDVLGAALKGDCRLVQVNVGGNINANNNDRANNGVALVTASANATFEIDSKAPAKDAAPQ